MLHEVLAASPLRIDTTLSNYDNFGPKLSLAVLVVLSQTFYHC